jgi:hypothetical protein
MYEKLGSYRRAYISKRNKFWKNIVSKTDFKVEILFDNISFEEAVIKEKEYIKLYGRRDLNEGTLVNLTNGGEGTVGATPWNKGKKYLMNLTQEQRNNISKKIKGRVLSQDTIEKIRIKNIGRKHSIESKKKVSLKNKGKIAWNKNKELTEEQKCKKYKKVLCIDTGVIFNSVKEAEKILNIRHISSVCRGERNTAGGLTFKYIIDIL